MSSAYEDFDVLSSDEMLAQINNLRVNSLTCWMFANSLLEYYQLHKKKGKIREYSTIVKKSLAEYHLTELFLKSKDAHDMQHAIMELEQLDVQRKKLDEKEEFEASALIRDKQKQIRNYLNQKNQQNEPVSKG